MNATFLCHGCSQVGDGELTQAEHFELRVIHYMFNVSSNYSHVFMLVLASVGFCSLEECDWEYHMRVFPFAGSNKESGAEKKEERRGMRPAIVVLIVVLVLGVVAVGLVVGYKYWRKKKRQQEQARFLKLFEDGDEIEDELGLEDTL